MGDGVPPGPAHVHTLKLEYADTDGTAKGERFFMWASKGAFKKFVMPKSRQCDLPAADIETVTYAMDGVAQRFDVKDFLSVIGFGAYKTQETRIPFYTTNGHLALQLIIKKAVDRDYQRLIGMSVERFEPCSCGSVTYKERMSVGNAFSGCNDCK